MTSDYPKTAVIGCGYWGKNLLRNLYDLGSLIAFCDPRKEVLADFATRYPGCTPHENVDDILADETIPAVVIATPAETHADLVRRALLAGKDVFVEKPLCLNSAEGRELVELAAREQRILMVGHLLWYHPAVLALKELINSGELGRVQYAYSTRLNLGKIRREENALWSFAPHDISVILGLLDAMPLSVQGQGGAYLQNEIPDVTVSLLAFPNGVKAHLFVSWLHPYKEQKLVVVGDRKMAVFNDMEPEDKLLLYPHSIEWKNQVPIAQKAEAKAVPLAKVEPLREECRHFLECVQTRERPRTDGQEGLRVLQVLQQCQEAMETKQPTVTATPKADWNAHESAYVDNGVRIGSGTRIWHFSHIMTGSEIGRDCRIGQNVVVGPRARVGDNVKIQNNVSVYEGVTLEDHVFCGPSMVFTNVNNPRCEIPRMDELRETIVRRGATLGANCTIVCGTEIGEYAFIGAGAVVTKDVPAYALIAGVPGRISGWMCSCGVKLAWEGEEASCECGSRYSKNGSTVAPL
ncbi:MAG: UDP-2-acetamido-3-amino-2,3-dideoxy-glucuronate N-acetyltransferase [Rhodothermales bacterium]|jgi:UDP-2-acetamido-3-amino-2,3-dideoxy-glucuronate N-acetyltransferase